eukprot:2402761-Pyramimonas_sp.AAC.1
MPIRKLTATSNQTPSCNLSDAAVPSDAPAQIISYKMITRYVKVAIFGIIRACVGLAVACMRGGGGLEETRTRGPFLGTRRQRILPRLRSRSTRMA